jgi:hypothetical protein
VLDLYFDPVSFSTFVVMFQFAFAQTMIRSLFALYNFLRIRQLLAEGNYPTLRTVVRYYNLLMVVLRIAYSTPILIAHTYFRAFRISLIAVSVRAAPGIEQ